jgi:hypothetical protein
MGRVYSTRVARGGDLALLPSIERAAAQMYLATAHSAVAAMAPIPVETLRAYQASGVVYVAVDATDQPVGFAVAFELGTDAYLRRASTSRGE